MEKTLRLAYNQTFSPSDKPLRWETETWLAELSHANPGSELRPLDKETVRELWSRTYNTDGKPDWSHIFPYYDDGIVFQDSVQRVEGIDAFKAMCDRLTNRCEQLNMDILSVVQDGSDIFLQWKMTMIFRRTPSTPMFGCSKLTLGSDGRIVHQRDYFDLWGDIFNGIPGWRRIYRKFLHRLFG